MVSGLRSSTASRSGLANRRLQLGLLSIVAIFATIALTRLPGWPLIDYRSFDYLSTIRAPQLPGDGPIIVAIDEPSLADINAQWPWPRSLHARLIDQLRIAGAKVIAFDVIFSEPSTPAEDGALARALGSDVVLAADQTLISSAQADQFVRTLPLKMFTDAGALPGFASINIHGDGFVREMPKFEDGFAGRIVQAAGMPVLPVSGNLMQAYGGPRTYPTVSYYQALDPANRLPPDTFRDRIVIIGLSLQNAPTIASAGADVFATPYTVHTGRLLSGVELQATVFDNLRTGSAIAEAGPSVKLMSVLLAVALAAGLVWRGTGWSTAVGGAFAIAAFVAASYLALRFGRIFASPLAPSLAFVAVAAAQTALDYARERRTRKQITRAFGQYLAPELVERLARDPKRLKLGGEKRMLSVLFCDVRGFTTIAEGMKDDPEQLIHLVNRLLTPLSDVILAHGGTIDKYIGDCIMAFWNAPLEIEAHAEKAVAAALDMLGALDRLNEELIAEAQAKGSTFPPLRIGIGINTGECVVGNMGSTRRFDYSAIGDAVNLASRLEAASKQIGMPLLIGETTAALVGGRFPLLELDRINVKGRIGSTMVATVLSGLAASAIDLHRQFINAMHAGDREGLQRLGEMLASEIPALENYYRQRSGQPDSISQGEN